MTPEHWQQVKALLEAALQREPGERAAFISKACRGDESLRREVESLIISHGKAGSFIEEPAFKINAEMLADEQTESLAGRSFGPYEILSRLGAGGMGDVYLAQDGRLGRKVALKLLPSHFTRDRDRLRRFQQEARSASALNHPNILTIYEVGEADDRPFIATEFIDGQTLREYTARALINLEEALDVAAQVASALAAAHKAGIIHRDIKPDNIMIRDDGFVKVLDFGLVKLTEKPAADSEGATLVNTDAGVVMGTAHYMSPEQARGLEVDARTDIWSLGVVLYEMVTGHTPFEGGTPSDVLSLILQREPAPLARYSPEVPTELERIIRKALHKDREERYQTVKDLLIDLKNLRRELELKAELERSASPNRSSEALTSSSAQAVAGIARKPAVQTGQIEAARPTSSAEYLVSEIKHHKRAFLLVAGTVVLALVGLGAFVIFTSMLPGEPATPSAVPQGMKLARVTSTGRASQAAVSPDGKYVVHVASESGQQSLRVRQINTTSDVQIVPPADVQYTWLTFARGGDFIYFVASEKSSATNILYQIPVLGGAPQKLVADVGSAITLSPDSQQLAFIRNFPSQGEQALIIVKADGNNERRLASRKLPNFFRSLSWSPDGKTIACAAGSFVPTYNSYVVEVAIDTGKEKSISSQAWLFMGQVAWLADGRGLILDASEQGSASFDSNQIWYLSYPGGVARRLTTDLNNYTSVSLTADSTRLVAVQSETVSNIWVAPSGDVSRATQITRGVGQRDGWSGLAWTTDGKIIYTSKASGNDDLWRMDPDGSNQRQLTTNAHTNSQPAVSQDGRYFLFTSDRAGTPNIWRIDTDAGNPKQLTSGSGENLAQSSPDGRWVLYTLLGTGKPTLWQVSINGGAPQQVTEKFTSAPVISPDGKLIACFYREDQPNSVNKIALLPVEGGEPIKVFDASTSIGGPIRWTPDGRALTYILTSGGISNIWSQAISGGSAKQLTNFKTDQIFWFDWSRDGKQLAVSRGTVTSDVVLMSNFR
ncbi:MAG: serine/threonine-protein kinase [Acidobacteriota bacterium]|nr:serine/threonine-protein kinase [Acidobacteriota bacterium]